MLVLTQQTFVGAESSRQEEEATTEDTARALPATRSTRWSLAMSRESRDATAPVSAVLVARRASRLRIFTQKNSSRRDPPADATRSVARGAVPETAGESRARWGGRAQGRVVRPGDAEFASVRPSVHSAMGAGRIAIGPPPLGPGGEPSPEGPDPQAGTPKVPPRTPLPCRPQTAPFWGPTMTAGGPSRRAARGARSRAGEARAERDVELTSGAGPRRERARGVTRAGLSARSRRARRVPGRRVAWLGGWILVYSRLRVKKMARFAKISLTGFRGRVDGVGRATLRGSSRAPPSPLVRSGAGS